MTWNRYGLYEPKGPPDWLKQPSASFAQTCPFSPQARNEDALAAERFPEAASSDPLIGRFENAYVGHVGEGGFRRDGSSGGMVTWVGAELLRLGLVDAVAHVAPSADGRFFAYTLSRDAVQLRAGAKSRYYPVELSGVLDAIRAQPGRYAVVGIPCLIKAVHLLRHTDPVFAERIAFTLGLFCGHMKSARFAESLAWQLGTDIEEVSGIEYRLKDTHRPANWYRAQLTGKDGSRRAQDWWHLADGDWGAGFFQASACNFCDDVVAETADISFGDAWIEPYASDGAGTNVVIARAPRLAQMLESAIADGRLALEPVDAGLVQQTQAAGLRQRRQGLAYRLTWPKRGLRPVKRVAPSAVLPFRRKLIYAMRHQISFWSHRMAWLAHATGQPALYLLWARAALALYHGLAYSRGRIGRLVERLGLKGREG